MITGTVDFMVSVDVECKDENKLNDKTDAVKKQIEEAFPKYRVEIGDQDLEDDDDDDDE